MLLEGGAIHDVIRATTLSNYAAARILPEIVVFGVTIPLIVSIQGLALVPEHTIRHHLVEVLTAGRRGEGSPEYPCRRALVHPLLQRGPD